MKILKPFSTKLFIQDLQRHNNVVCVDVSRCNLLWIIYVLFKLPLCRETSTQMVLNLLKAKENVNVPLDCPAAKKPQQIVAAQPKNSNKHKVQTQQQTQGIHTLTQ